MVFWTLQIVFRIFFLPIASQSVNFFLIIFYLRVDAFVFFVFFNFDGCSQKESLLFEGLLIMVHVFIGRE